MFKKIAACIAAIHTEDDINTVCGMIDTAFHQEKITYKDHEVLYAIIEKIKVD